MKKGKDLMDLALVGQDDGTKIGTVLDLIFDTENDQLLAFLVSGRDLFGLIPAQIVPWSAVASVGADVILLRNSQSKMALSDHAEVARVAQNSRETVLSGTAILTTEGRNLGTLADVVIDETTGRVLGYEISGGFVADSLRGKKFLPAPPGLVVGQDAAIATPEAVGEMRRV